METCRQRALGCVDETADWRLLVPQHGCYQCWKGCAGRRIDSVSPVPKDIVSVRDSEDDNDKNNIPETRRPP